MEKNLFLVFFLSEVNVLSPSDVSCPLYLSY